jgi:hypothetical protein
MLSELDVVHRKTEQAYAGFLDLLLETCISLLPVDSHLHTHLRLLQLRLSPPLTSSELAVLSRALESVMGELTQSHSLPAGQRQQNRSLL